VIAACAFVSIYLLHVPFPLIVFGAGIVGLVLTKRADRRETETSTTRSQTLDPQARLSWPRVIRALAYAMILWLVPLGLLFWKRGGSSLHVQEYLFFTRAAFVTFGGAYAVLAYVTQVVAGSYGWLTQAQAVDGLALAETTPGPLIMVLQFVGYMAAWNHPEGLTPPVSAVIGALATTYVTFLPGFLFIFLGAPYIETLRGNRHLTSALSGVTAAVVGVMLNLAVVFAGAVLWPHGGLAGVDWAAIGIATLAAVVLIRFKVDIVWVVCAGEIAGLIRYVWF
jgi:chromate transporter